MSRVKEMAKGCECNTGGDVAEALNNFTHWQIAEACSRAKANGRKTLRNYDFQASHLPDPGVTLITLSKVKELAKASGLNCSANAFDGLRAQLAWVVGSGCRRAILNGRKTLRGHDILLK